MLYIEDIVPESEGCAACCIFCMDYDLMQRDGTNKTERLDEAQAFVRGMSEKH